MARVLDGNVLYTMAVYYVNGLLMLLGPENMMAELTEGDFSRLNLVRSFLSRTEK